MLREVKVCVDAKLNMFRDYLDVPENMKARVDAFISNTTALGEKSANAVDFEAAFANTGLAEEFNSIVPQCTPKAVPVSDEWQAESKRIRKQMRKEYVRNDLAKDVAGRVIDEASYHAKMKWSAWNVIS